MRLIVPDTLSVRAALSRRGRRKSGLWRCLGQRLSCSYRRASRHRLSRGRHRRKIVPSLVFSFLAARICGLLAWPCCSRNLSMSKVFPKANAWRSVFRETACSDEHERASAVALLAGSTALWVDAARRRGVGQARRGEYQPRNRGGLVVS